METTIERRPTPHEAREAKGLSLYMAAKLAGTSHQNVYNAEHGASPTPRVRELLARAYGFDSADAIEWSERQEFPFRPDGRLGVIAYFERMYPMVAADLRRAAQLWAEDATFREHWRRFVAEARSNATATEQFEPGFEDMMRLLRQHLGEQE